MTSMIVFSNAQIFTATTHDLEPDANCLLIKDELIEHIGRIDDEDIQRACEAGAFVYDVCGRLISPGFIDGHIHITQFAYSLNAISLGQCKSLKDIRAKIRKEAAAQPHLPRLFCHGWRHFMTDGKALASDLDDLDPRPIFINSQDLHSAWCNTAALNELNIASESDPEGGEIRRDSAGKPNGLLHETAAMKFVWPYQARVTTQEEKLDQISEAMTTYLAAGYTGAIEMATDEDIWSLLTTLHSQGRLPLRIAAHWLIVPCSTTAENLAQVERAVELHKLYNATSSPDLRIAGIKLICDGLIDTCTASLREPYSNGTNPDPIWPYEKILPVIHHADAAGLQCALHAIGDNTVRVAIDALSTLIPTGTDLSCNGCKNRRHRIEHLELTHPSDAVRLGKNGITASIQPFHADPSMNTHWPPLIGKDRCSRGYAYSDFAAQGAPLAIGTDAPTSQYEPLRNLYAATTRRSVREDRLSDSATVNEQFKLSLGQALRASTQGAAYSCFADDRVGTLEKGKYADLVILDLEWDEKSLLKGVVEETWMGGRRVF